MTHNTARIALTLVFMVAGELSGYSQGFINLDFESATIITSGSPSLVLAAQALPGWTAGFPSDAVILYNTVSIGGAALSIHDSNDPFNPPIAGRYGVGLQGASPGTVSAGIRQTGQIPGNAQSLTFLGQLGSLQISFNNQPLSYFAIGSGANYRIYGADVSAFAGQTGELSFVALPNRGGFIDNIQFSNVPIPEPGVFGLSALGALLIGWRLLPRLR
jgi:hypothetical protein